MAVFKQPQRSVACEDMPWCESRVVVVKGNDHNEFGLHENTTNRRGSGLSTNGHLLYVRCPIHTADGQWPRICEKNNTKLGWYVSRNEARAWKAETFPKSRISWKIQWTNMLVAWMSDNNTKTMSERLRCIQSKKRPALYSGIKTSPYETEFGGRRGSDLGILCSLKTCTVQQKLEKYWNGSLMQEWITVETRKSRKRATNRIE